MSLWQSLVLGIYMAVAVLTKGLNLAVVKLSTVQVTHLSLYHKIRKIGKICFAKPVLTEDFHIMRKKEFSITCHMCDTYTSRKAKHAHKRQTYLLVREVFFFYMRIVGGGVQSVSTQHRGHLLSYCTCLGCLWGWRIFGGMKIGRGNRSTRRKPAPGPLCPPQIPLYHTGDRTRAAAVGSQRLTAWAMARPREGVTWGLWTQVFSWKENSCLEFEGARRQDEQIGDKPPVIK
jgi:hypothetical protein